jgi:oxygen-independent coproporphyrinogen-3 oxidase
MVGAGVSSFSFLGGVHFQNLDRVEDYIATVEKGNLPLKRALPVGDTEQLIRELILQMKLGSLDLQYFREKFQRDVMKEFQPAFENLKDQGYLDWQGDRVVLSRNGLLRVDTLLPGFFLPEHRDARYT